MKDQEEELQKRFEAGEIPKGDDLDIKSYQYVFDALKKQPASSLSSGFADRVVAKVVVNAKRDARRDMFWLVTGVFFIIIAFVVAVVMTGFKLEFGFLKNISGYTGIFVFGIGFILLLSWLDKRLVQQQRQ